MLGWYAIGRSSTFSFMPQCFCTQRMNRQPVRVQKVYITTNIIHMPNVAGMMRYSGREPRSSLSSAREKSSSGVPLIVKVWLTPTPLTYSVTVCTTPLPIRSQCTPKR